MASGRSIEPVIAEKSKIQISDKVLQPADALHERDEQYRVLIDFCPDAIFINNGEHILFANPATVKLLGAQSDDQIVGLPVVDIVPEKYRTYVKERQAEILESGNSVGRKEQQYLRLDGTVVNVETQGTQITFNQKPAILVIAHDISDQKKIGRNVTRCD